MARKVGYVLIGIALLHTVFGFIFFPAQIADVLGAGVLNAVTEAYWDRNAAFWYFVFGAMLALYGAMTQWVIEAVGRLPRFWGWGFLALCVVGIVCMPVSGFWTGLPAAYWMIRHYNEPQTVRKPLPA
jgi:hypothetical protein